MWDETCALSNRVEELEEENTVLKKENELLKLQLKKVELKFVNNVSEDMINKVREAFTKTDVSGQAVRTAAKFANVLQEIFDQLGEDEFIKTKYKSVEDLVDDYKNLENY